MTMLYYKVADKDGELLAIGKDRGEGMIFYEHGVFVMTKALHKWISEELKIDFHSWQWRFLNQVEFETFQAFGIKEINALAIPEHHL